MTTPPTKIQTGRVTTEGDRLYYEVRGQGPALLMIAAAGGDADYYAPIADILADEYKVITFDRRANSRSTIHNPQNFEISQQSRDAIAVLRDAGEESAFVFGNSSGAVIALDMAKTQSQAVRAVVPHEAPIPRLLPDALKWQRFFASAYLTGLRFGSTLGALQFMLGVGLPVVKLSQAQRKAQTYAMRCRGGQDEPRISVQAGLDVLIRWELLPVTNYLPDVEAIRKNGVKAYPAVGQWGLERKKWYVRANQVLAEQLDREVIVFPGHHGGYMDQPEAFAAVLRDVLHRAAK